MLNGVLITMDEIRQGKRLPIGTRVSYGDMANPRAVAVVVSDVIGEWDHGQKCIYVDSYHQTTVSQVAIDGPGGWQMEEGLASADEIVALKARAANLLVQNQKRSEEATKKANEREAAGKALVEKHMPACAKAVIIATRVKNNCDLMTDYYNTITERTIILAWSKYTRDLFPEMRKACRNSDILEIRALIDAPKDQAEHREKWSMGHGYYLKDGDHYSTGWEVSKMGLDGDYWMRNLHRIAGEPDSWPIPATEKVTAAPEVVKVDTVTITENEEKDGVEVRFPEKPDASVLDHLKTNGFRWSRFAKCWYKTRSPEALELAYGLKEDSNA